MDLIKICPVCGEKNPADAFDCKCGYDLLMVSPETDTVDGADLFQWFIGQCKA